ncbi:hypothetical protein B0H13DRAFT_2337154 [Mycena leptocephala]|nr:hypothetical protein B0H13DRAFT_2337154 [Mycena leptocephala]
MAQATSSNTQDLGTYAFIIGINQTDDLHPLRGAVNDARAFENTSWMYATSRPRISLCSRIRRPHAMPLCPPLYPPLHNPNIPDHGEATMILFFAGHGSRFDAPDDLIAPERRVEAICPVDERTTNDAGEYVHAIPDYTLVRLLSELAGKKGTNITVILDCCHAGPSFVAVWNGIRGDSGCSYCPVGLPFHPLNLDSHFWKGKNDTVQSYRIWTKSSSSYVLLAACRAGETAREVLYPDGTYHGRFTTHLVSLLQQTPVESATCAELLNLIPKKWPGQTPYCGGTRSNQIAQIQSASSSQFFRVEMGTVEGVVPGTEFSAYDRKNNYLCTFIAQSVEVGETILVRDESQPPVDIPPWSRAVVSDWKSSPMLVYTPADFPYTSVLFPTTGPPKFVPVSSLEEAHIVACKAGLALGDPAHLPHAIDGVAHFSYFLDCGNEADRLEGVELEMHRLLGEYPFCVPDSQDGNMIKDGVVQVTSKAGAKYGFTIRNTSDEDLFPYLFYFDPHTCTIQNWYSPTGAGVEPPLHSGGW